MPGETGPSPEDMGLTPEQKKRRILTEAELIRGGAEYTDSGSLEVSEEDRARVEREMNANLLAKGLLKNFSLMEIQHLQKAADFYRDALEKGRDISEDLKDQSKNLYIRLRDAYDAALEQERE